MNAFVFDAEEEHPHAGVPVVDGVLLDVVDDAEHHLLDLLPELAGLLHAGPVVVALGEVVPVHLVHAHREHLLELLVDAVLDRAVVEQLVDVEGGRVPEVENERVSQWLGPDVIGPVDLEQLEQFLVDCIGL